jgi:PAS domain S-box-containing protein
MKREQAYAELEDRIRELEHDLLQARESARKNEERYRNILEKMQEAYYEVDLLGNFTVFNSSAVKGLGYTNEEMLGMNFRKFVDHENARKLLEVYHRVFVTGRPVTGCDWEVITKAGETFPVSSSVSLKYDDDGNPAGFQGIVRDIRDRKKAEEALRQSEERYRNILNDMQEAYYEVDFEGNLFFFNLPAMTRLGYSDVEMRSMNFHRLTDEENAQKLFKEYSRAFLTGKPITGLEWEVITKSGVKIPVEASASLRYDAAGNPVGFKGIVRDVSERHKAQEALRRSEEKYRTILESIQEGYLELDLAGNVVFFNNFSCRLLGYSRSELLGMNYRVFTTPDTARYLYQVFHTIYLTGRPGIAADYGVVRKDGARKIHELSASLVRDPSGSPVGFRGIVRDITERKMAEEALRQSEERWQFALEGAGDGVWDLDLKTGVTFRSRRWKEMLGYGEHDITDTREEWLRLVHPQDREESDRNLEEHLRGEAPVYKSEYRMRYSDGSYRWILDRGKIVEWDAEGSPLRIIGTQTDVSDRKHAEEVLKQSEELYRTIFEHTATANIIADEDTTILLANSRFAKLVGCSKQEMEGKVKWTSFVAEKDREKMIRNNARRTADPGSVPGTYEFLGVVGPGEQRNFFISVAVIPGTSQRIVSLMDITDRKKAEEALRQSEERFRDMARLMPETVYETDETGEITFANEAAFEKFQYSPEDLDSAVSLQELVASEERQRASEHFRRVMNGERIGLTEYLARRKDGTTFPVLVHTAVITNNGTPSGTRGFAVDISDKKILEQQLMRAQKMEAIGTLAGGIAHDFNNLLMGVLGNVSLMLLDMERTHPFHDRLKNIEEYVHRGSELTRQFLGFARGGKYEVKTTHLGDFIHKSAEMFGRTKKEIAIHERVQDGLWPVDVDRSQMEQVMLNLYVNAWQAMPGGGDLYLSTENVELGSEDVAPFGVRTGRYVKVSVADTGVGIDESIKARIFEPFFTTKGKGRGTGLGLASVYGIIKNHKGFITVDSRKGAGATFTLYLPASAGVVEEDRLPSGDIQTGRETVLLVDDEEMVLEVGSEILKKLGYRVVTASGGRAAIEAFNSDRDSIALVVLDMIMPDLGGRETFEALKKIDPGVKVLLSSGYSLGGQAGEIMESGCSGFIQKPFSIKDLAEKIREILDGG